jgi:hypothetical protein
MSKWQLEYCSHCTTQALVLSSSEQICQVISGVAQIFYGIKVLEWLRLGPTDYKLPLQALDDGYVSSVRCAIAKFVRQLGNELLKR